MKTLLPILLAAVLLSCSGNDTPTEEQRTKVPVQPVAETPVEWTGYYTGIMRTPNLPEVEFALWVRSDSSFVLQQRYVDSDSVPRGTIGQWQVVNGLLMTEHPGYLPAYYRYTPDGLLQVNGDGQSFDTPFPHYMSKLADEIGDAIPRMRLAGTFTYYADAMSFTPCGSRFSWPCAGGEQWTDEGEVLGSLNTAELERHYLRSVKQGGDPWLIEVECNLAMGPAMEGDGADEYLFIHRVLGPIEACP